MQISKDDRFAISRSLSQLIFRNSDGGHIRVVKRDRVRKSGASLYRVRIDNENDRVAFL